MNNNFLIIKRIIVLVIILLGFLEALLSNLVTNFSNNIELIRNYANSLEEVSSDINIYLMLLSLSLILLLLILSALDTNKIFKLKTSWIGIAGVILFTLFGLIPTGDVVIEFHNSANIRYLLYALLGSLITLNFVEEHMQEKQI